MGVFSCVTRLQVRDEDGGGVTVSISCDILPLVALSVHCQKIPNLYVMMSVYRKQKESFFSIFLSYVLFL